MAIGTFTLTGNLTTYANLERAGGYGSLIIRAIPDSTPVPTEHQTLVQPDPFPIASDGTFSIQLDAIAGVKYRVSTSPRSLFPSFVFDALAAGQTRDLSELQPVPATSPTVPYLVGPGVPAGGTTGQALVKATGADYDTVWSDAGTGGSTPDATASVKGKVQLAGDLGGTAAAPTVPGLAGKAATVHTHATSDVTGLDAALAGKQPAGSYAAATHTHPASQVSDSTTVGRALITAADAAAARAAIGAGVSSFDGAYGSLTGKPTLGTAAATAATDYATAAQGTKADSASQPGHTHAQTDVTGLTAALAGKALNTITVTAGTGLTGGGDLTANRTLTVDFAGAGVTTAGKVVNASDARLSDARTPLAHNHAGSEITSGTVAYARLPTGTTSSTVAAGDHLHDARYPVVVVHGTTAGTARPSGATVVLWVGTVAPTNAIAGDQWDDSGAVVVNYINEPTSEGTAGQVLTTNGAGVRTWTSGGAAAQPVNVQTGTTYTVQSSDAGKLVTLSNASAITVTVPAVLAIGQRVDFLVIGAGLPTFAGSGVTINGYPSLVAKAQWTAFSAICYATNAVAVVGGLA